jgi:hypothetical protein
MSLEARRGLAVVGAPLHPVVPSTAARQELAVEAVVVGVRLYLAVPSSEAQQGLAVEAAVVGGRLYLVVPSLEARQGLAAVLGGRESEEHSVQEVENWQEEPPPSAEVSMEAGGQSAWWSVLDRARRSHSRK